MTKIFNLITRFRKNRGFLTIVGFLSFLVFAAVAMLLLESTQTDSGINSFFQSLWFSIVTVTTVGYGDLSPLSGVGKIGAIIIMFIGVVYVGVLTGNITSWLVERDRRKVLGLVPVKNIEDHFLVCGWKPGMNNLLKNILLLHKIDSSKLVLINDADSQEVNELKKDSKLRDLHFYSGDYTNSEILYNVCGNKAGKVLILADELSGKTAEEIDFKTVLATIAIKSLYPQIYSIVEVVQQKFRRYLVNAGAEEIILNRYSARAHICNIILMSGMNNIFKTFFQMENGILKISEISDNNIGLTYQEIKEKRNDVVIIGILENTGNLRLRKYEKMGQIQKSVTIKNAIQGLMEIKNMESNVPVFHPSPDYIVNENSSLIVLNVSPVRLNKKHPIEIEQEKKFLKKSTDQLILHQLSKCVDRYNNWSKLSDFLKLMDIEIYQYHNCLEGVMHKEKKYTFESLKLPSQVLEKLQQIFDRKEKIENKISGIINQTLIDAENWYKFYDLLHEKGLKVYLYRNKAYGFIYKDRRYNFESLEIRKQLSEEIIKHKPLYHQVSTKKKLEFEHIPLNEFLMMYEKTESFSIFKPTASKGLLLICGWKPQLLQILEFITLHHPKHETSWSKIVVIAETDKSNCDAFNNKFAENPNVELTIGDFSDPAVLEKAGILQAAKVIILAETDSGKSFEEIDAKTVLSAMLVGTINRRTYIVTEILDKRYEEALDQANVEEVFLEDDFVQIMLSNGSHGLGITKVISELLNFNNTIFELAIIEKQYQNKPFGELQKNFYVPRKMLIGLLEDTGNIYTRKSSKINLAQIQSNIQGQVEELIKVKDLVLNNVIIAPKSDHIITSSSKLILINSNQQKSWESHIEYYS